MVVLIDAWPLDVMRLLLDEPWYCLPLCCPPLHTLQGSSCSGPSCTAAAPPMYCLCPLMYCPRRWRRGCPRTAWRRMPSRVRCGARPCPSPITRTCPSRWVVHRLSMFALVEVAPFGVVDHTHACLLNPPPPPPHEALLGFLSCHNPKPYPPAPPSTCLPCLPPIPPCRRCWPWWRTTGGSGGAWRTWAPGWRSGRHSGGASRSGCWCASR